jgi:hypothetical protein
MSKSLHLTLSWFTSNGSQSQMSCSYSTLRRGSAGCRTPSWTGTIFSEIEQQKIHVLKGRYLLTRDKSGTCCTLLCVWHKPMAWHATCYCCVTRAPTEVTWRVISRNTQETTILKWNKCKQMEQRPLSWHKPSAYTTTVSVNSFYSGTTAHASTQRMVVCTWIAKLGGTRQSGESNTP